MADKLAKLALINKPIIECSDGYTFIKDIEIGELIRTQSDTQAVILNHTKVSTLSSVTYFANTTKKNQFVALVTVIDTDDEFFQSRIELKDNIRQVIAFDAQIVLKIPAQKVIKITKAPYVDYYLLYADSRNEIDALVQKALGNQEEDLVEHLNNQNVLYVEEQTKLLEIKKDEVTGLSEYSDTKTQKKLQSAKGPILNCLGENNRDLAMLYTPKLAEVC